MVVEAMMTGEEKVRLAAKMTDEVHELVRRAEGRLGAIRNINGLGLYMEPHDVSLQISLALSDLRIAELVLGGSMAHWPTEADQSSV